jgi:hypothetical protein
MLDKKVQDLISELLSDLDTMYLETFGYDEQPIMMSCYKRALDVVASHYPNEFEEASKLERVK